MVEKYAKAALPLSSVAAAVSESAQPNVHGVVTAPQTHLPPAALEARLKQLISMAPTVLFMKGTPQQPRCGFSRQTVELLAKYNARYSTFNILADEQVRQGAFDVISTRHSILITLIVSLAES